MSVVRRIIVHCQLSIVNYQLLPALVLRKIFDHNMLRCTKNRGVFSNKIRRCVLLWNMGGYAIMYAIIHHNMAIFPRRYP